MKNVVLNCTFGCTSKYKPELKAKHTMLYMYRATPNHINSN